MPAYYNEHDPYVAQWLRNLIAAGHIAPGDVDERSITEVHPDDVRPYTQCHFFAGLGGWSLALRLAGWPDDRPIWTGSCPCQPFSVAGKQRGAADERHLWPEFFRLIRECRPATAVGEQVAGSAGLAWLDLVFADLEGAGYAVGAVDMPACSVGAPHRRQRLYWVANANGWHAEEDGAERIQRGREYGLQPKGSGADAVAHADGVGLLDRERHLRQDEPEQPPPSRYDTDRRGAVRGLGRAAEWHNPWADVVWIPCADGRARPAKPGLFPLVDGAAGRVAQLRAYGNAIVPQVGAAFIRAVMDALD
jgi:DNA (cytosine-5)-methyltransferase 1